MHRDKDAKMAIWQKNSNFAILALLSLCIDFKNSFRKMTSGWVLWKTSYKLFFKKCLRAYLGSSMSLSKRINWIFSSFLHGISEILFVLSFNKFLASLESKFRMVKVFVIKVCKKTLWAAWSLHHLKFPIGFGRLSKEKWVLNSLLNKNVFLTKVEHTNSIAAVYL